eukprot:TRINITY_DN2477_c0_g1_i10.p1 TRINITY_DN2477_c0_g1~~TRINITY_DN2477_c0_g1_i10.p1  ORF type:complete len:1103 (-),score=232.14 TRINITY_DN2477_c0_g1_i10:59-3367(-)
MLYPLTLIFYFLMRRRPPISTLSSSSAASDVYKRQMQMEQTGKEEKIETYQKEEEQPKQSEEKELEPIEQQKELESIEQQIIKKKNEEAKEIQNQKEQKQKQQQQQFDDQESTATATWVPPKQSVNPIQAQINEEDGTVTENWVKVQQDATKMPAYEVTSTQYFSQGNKEKQNKITDDIIFEIQDEDENPEFKTFISQFGKEVFGDDIENNIEYFLKTTTILKVLGQGAFGKVVKAYTPVYGVYLAMKYFKDEEKAQEEILQYQYLLKLNSPMIMKFYMAFKNPEGQVVLVLQYGTTDLANLIGAHKSYSPGQIFYFLHQVIPGFVQLKNELQIAHRDIKPENFILADTKTEFIICDFGEACVVDAQGQITDLSHGTLPYMAPEVFQNYEHCCADDFGYTITYDPYKADIYSIGVTLLMMAGMPKQLRNQLRSVQGQREILDDCAQQSQILSQLIEKMIKINPNERINYDELDKILFSIQESMIIIQEEEFMQLVVENAQKFNSDEEKIKYYEDLMNLNHSLGLNKDERDNMLQIFDLKKKYCKNNNKLKELVLFYERFLELSQELNLSASFNADVLAELAIHVQEYIDLQKQLKLGETKEWLIYAVKTQMFALFEESYLLEKIELTKKLGMDNDFYSLIWKNHFYQHKVANNKKSKEEDDKWKQEIKEHLKRVKPIEIKDIESTKEEIRRIWIISFHGNEQEKQELEKYVNQQMEKWKTNKEIHFEFYNFKYQNYLTMDQKVENFDEYIEEKKRIYGKFSKELLYDGMMVIPTKFSQFMGQFPSITEDTYKSEIEKYYKLFKEINWAYKLSFSIQGAESPNIQMYAMIVGYIWGQLVDLKWKFERVVPKEMQELDFTENEQRLLAKMLSIEDPKTNEILGFTLKKHILTVQFYSDIFDLITQIEDEVETEKRYKSIMYLLAMCQKFYQKLFEQASSSKQDVIAQQAFAQAETYNQNVLDKFNYYRKQKKPEWEDIVELKQKVQEFSINRLAKAKTRIQMILNQKRKINQLKENLQILTNKKKTLDVNGEFYLFKISTIFEEINSILASNIEDVETPNDKQLFREGFALATDLINFLQKTKMDRLDYLNELFDKLKTLFKNF